MPATETKKPDNGHIRWMIRRDMEEVLAIESAVFEFPWSEEDFIRCLRSRNCIGMVSEDVKTERIMGFMIYELHTSRLHLLSMAVNPSVQRCGIGRQMLAKLASKLSAQRRSRILCEVRESNLGAQLFLKRHGYECTSVLRDFYDDTSEDAYLFQTRHGERAHKPTNRIAGLIEL